MKRCFGLIVLAVFSILLGCSLGRPPAVQSDVPLYGYRVVNAYPHDPKAFTQGLLYRDGFLFESTGRFGLSSLRKVRLETGEIVQEQRIGNRYWGEGLTKWKDQLIQITWQSKVAFVYDSTSFKLQNTLRYSGEGWGLTHDGNQLIMSDGSDTLRLLDPVSFSLKRRVPVRDGSAPVYRMNELEYVRGEVYANIWHTDRIARISPASGRVVGWIDLKGLLPPVYQLDDPEAVLNGIAYDADNNRLFVTGKLWPRLFEIELMRQ
jgi:glutaminyl-peptide cyclotransferase